MSRTKTLVFANTFAFSAMVTINYLSNSLPLNGKTPGELSDQYPNLFVPAGLTFSIWGIIYLLLIGWIITQIIGLTKKKTIQNNWSSIPSIGWLFVVSCLLNIAWLFAWHWEQVLLSVFVMVGLLTALVFLNQVLSEQNQYSGTAEKFFSFSAFGVYQGWITVALIANITALLVKSGWQGGGISQEIWTNLMIFIGGTLAVFMIWKRNIWFHGLAVAWAFYGIYLKRNALADADSVKFAALVLMILVLVSMVLSFKKWRSLAF